MRTMLNELKLSTDDLAKMARVSVHTMRDWQLGRRSPSPAARRRLAQGLNRYLQRVERIIAELELED